MGDVGVRLLGPVEVRRGGLLVSIERVQVRRLLALLSVHPAAPWSSDQLIEELWPGDLPRSPRAALRVVASRLRHALGEDASLLALTGDAYRLELDPDRVDVAAFDTLLAGEPPVEAIDAAVELWRGPPFGGAQGPPALDRHAGRLERARAAACVRRGELLLDARAFDRATAVLVTTVEEDPTDEHAAVLLARALIGSGRRIDALAVVRRTAAALRDTYGIGPGNELSAAEGDILVASGTVADSAPDTAPDTAVTARRRNDAPPRSGLFGRDEVIDTGVAWLDTPPRREGAPCLLIEGSPGIGKSALAVAVAERLGGRTLHAYCDPDRGHAGSLASVLRVDPPTRSGDALSWTLAMVDALIDRAVGAVAGGDRLTLVLDDLQWAGEVEVRFLARVVRSPGTERLAVVVTSRHDPPDDPAAGRLLDRFTSDDHTRRIRLGPLDAGAVRAAYAAWGGRPLTAPAAGALIELSGGIPYLVRAIALTGEDPSTLDRDELSDSLGDTVATRLEHLDAASAAILRTAAALGREIDLPLLAAVHDTEVVTVAAAIDAATIAALVTPSPEGTIRFDHELTRVHLAHQVGPATLLVLHRAVAAACVALGRDATKLARHVVGAGPLCADTVAVADLLAGADLASEQGALAEAARFLARAAELEPDDARRAEIEGHRAWALECAGDRPAAEPLIEEVFATARRNDWRELMARTVLAGRPFGAVVGSDEVRQHRLAIALAQPPSDDRLRLELAAAMIGELDSADLPIPGELGRAVDSLAADDDTRVVRLGVRLLRVVRRTPCSPDHVAQAVEYVGAARQTGYPLNLLDAEETLARVLLTVGDVAGAATAQADLARTVRVHRWPRYMWTSALLAAVLTDLHRGPAAAGELVSRALTIGDEHGVQDAINAYALFKVSEAYRLGGLADYGPVVRAATQRPSGVPAWHAILAACLAEAGDPVGAEHELDAFVGLSSAAPKLFHHVGVVFAVRAACRIGTHRVLPRCIDWLLPWSGNLVIAGVGAACFGPADSVLAEAMAALRDERAASCAEAGERLLAANGATGWSTGS